MTDQSSDENPKMPLKKYIWDSELKILDNEIKDEDITIIEAPSGAKEALIKVDGITFPKVLADNGMAPDIRTNITKIKEMTARDDDVLICAFSKSGTHWISEIIAMLKKGKAEYNNLLKEKLMLELHIPEEFDTLKAPRILNTHLLFRQIPKQMIEKKCKIIFIQRNPKDVAVSLYNFRKALYKRNNSRWDDQVALFGSSVAYFCWYDYTLQWEKDLEDISYIYSVYYEDIKRDPIGEIKKLAEYLEVKCSDELVTDIANKCNFDNMKKAKSEKQEQAIATAAAIYRKGQVGDWKNWFTVAQNERFDAEYKERMKNSKLKFTYTLP